MTAPADCILNEHVQTRSLSPLGSTDLLQPNLTCCLPFHLTSGGSTAWAWQHYSSLQRKQALEKHRALISSATVHLLHLLATAVVGSVLLIDARRTRRRIASSPAGCALSHRLEALWTR